MLLIENLDVTLQVFAYTKRQQIMSDDNCLDVASQGGPVNLIRCHGMGGNQAWSYDETVWFKLFIIESNEVHRDVREYYNFSVGW